MKHSLHTKNGSVIITMKEIGNDKVTIVQNLTTVKKEILIVQQTNMRNYNPWIYNLMPKLMNLIRSQSQGQKNLDS